VGGANVLNDVLNRLVSMRGTSTLVRYSPEAGQLMGEFEDSLRRKRKTATEALLVVYPKLVTYAHRLCLLLHYLCDSDPDRTDISYDTVERTIRLLNFFENSMQRACSHIELSLEEQKAKRVYEKLKSLGAATSQNIRNLLRRHLKSAEVSQILKQLQADGVIESFKKDNVTYFRIRT